jgi:hypothetical protein
VGKKRKGYRRGIYGDVGENCLLLMFGVWNEKSCGRGAIWCMLQCTGLMQRMLERVRIM